MLRTVRDRVHSDGMTDMTEPNPGEAAVDAAPPSTPAKTESSAPTVVASLWLALTIIVGAVLIFGTEYEVYGGDAYTGLQNVMARAVNSLGFVLIGTGVLALVIALSRRR